MNTAYKVEEIFSKNAAYQKFEVLKSNRNKRHRYGEFIVEGVRNINEAVKNGWHVKSFIYSRKRKLSRWAQDLLPLAPINYALADNLMAELSDRDETSELLAILGMEQPPAPHLGENPAIVLFDRPSNKGNLGTILRSADALGVNQLLITGRSVDIYDSEVIQASMGSFFKLPFLQLSGRQEIEAYVESLRQQYPNLIIVGTQEDTGRAIHEVDLCSPVLFMLGNEKDGLNHHLHGLCDVLAEIPMGIDRAASSLNVSCAATVVFYEMCRQRRL